MATARSTPKGSNDAGIGRAPDWRGGYSEIVFFQDERALQEFTNGNFEFDAGAQAVVVTAAAQGQAGTTGASAGASAGNNNASTAGNYYKGMATFIVTKGGLIAGVSIGGQKFDYKRL